MYAIDVPFPDLQTSRSLDDNSPRKYVKNENEQDLDMYCGSPFDVDPDYDKTPYGFADKAIKYGHPRAISSRLFPPYELNRMIYRWYSMASPITNVRSAAVTDLDGHQLYTLIVDDRRGKTFLLQYVTMDKQNTLTKLDPYKPNDSLEWMI